MIAAVTFNPAVSLLASAACALLWTRFTGWFGRVGAALLLLVAWLLADGSVAVVLAERTASELGGPASWVMWASAAASLVVGYVLPAWAGAFVGERVTVGTGWLSAAAVALSVSGGLSVIAGALG